MVLPLVLNLYGAYWSDSVNAGSSKKNIELKQCWVYGYIFNNSFCLPVVGILHNFMQIYHQTHHFEYVML